MKMRFIITLLALFTSVASAGTCDEKSDTNFIVKLSVENGHVLTNVTQD